MKDDNSAHEQRPDPDELLDRYGLRESAAMNATDDNEEDEEVAPSAQPGDSHRPTRGRLRVYLGMAAGVGKTYAMLNEGRRRKERGTDVAIGYVEAHHRPRTAEQIGDLEIIPRKSIPYKGIILEEMDVDAILRRHPTVALVDELAHTNAPGSRNAKRYQDVEELLAAGITVISTLNIQHLESLNDLIESITGVRQRETLPDRILDQADEVELIDIAPDALRARLRHGNVYPPERAQRALDNYFSMSNLTALRELALRRTAEKTEAQLEGMMRGGERLAESAWQTTATERVMVAFDARPHSQQLLRDGWRLARGLKAPLLAVTVSKPVWQGGHNHRDHLTAEDDALRANERLAEDLGAEVLHLQGIDIAATLARVAHERHVTQIVIGQPTQSRWREALFGSVVNRLLRLATGADVHVVPRRNGSK
ncbi:MAG TPA: universal stress protein [Ktedonobacterales bacterium]|nr:universal stress protein [Ktedonobacterales bacterium]